MACPRCGTENPDQAHFCANCGTTLPAASGAPAPQPGGQETVIAPPPQPETIIAPPAATQPPTQFTPPPAAAVPPPYQPPAGAPPLQPPSYPPIGQQPTGVVPPQYPTAGLPPPDYPQQGYGYAPPQAPRPAAKSSMPLLAGIIGVLALAGIGAGAYFLFLKGDDDKSSPASSETSQAGTRTPGTASGPILDTKKGDELAHLAIPNTGDLPGTGWTVDKDDDFSKSPTHFVTATCKTADTKSDDLRASVDKVTAGKAKRVLDNNTAPRVTVEIRVHTDTKAIDQAIKDNVTLYKDYATCLAEELNNDPDTKASKWTVTTAKPLGTVPNSGFSAGYAIKDTTQNESLEFETYVWRYGNSSISVDFLGQDGARITATFVRSVIDKLMLRVDQVAKNPDVLKKATPTPEPSATKTTTSTSRSPSPSPSTTSTSRSPSPSTTSTSRSPSPSTTTTSGDLDTWATKACTAFNGVGDAYGELYFEYLGADGSVDDYRKALTPLIATLKQKSQEALTTLKGAQTPSQARPVSDAMQTFLNGIVSSVDTLTRAVNAAKTTDDIDNAWDTFDTSITTMGNKFDDATKNNTQVMDLLNEKCP